jgi:hypothetical protein
MENQVRQKQLKRSTDRSHRRKPLRLGISRRLARTLTGREVFVTQVSFGKKSAVLVPWQDQHHPQHP